MGPFTTYHFYEALHDLSLLWGPLPLITSMGAFTAYLFLFIVYKQEFLDQFSKMLQSTTVEPNSSSVSLESPRYEANNIDNIAGQ